jgi:hypothetical protein
MESTSHLEATESLQIVQAAEAASYAPRPMPRWYTPSVAAALSVHTAVMGTGNQDVKAIASVVYAVFIGVLIGVVYRKQGRQPRMRTMPKPLRRHTMRNVALLLVTLISVDAAIWYRKVNHPWFWIAGAGFVMMNIAGPLMERSYARAYDRWLATK